MNLYQCAGILVDRGLPSVAQLPAPFVDQHVIREAQNARLRVNFDLQALVLQRLLQVVEDLCPGSVSTGQLLGFRLQIQCEVGQQDDENEKKANHHVRHGHEVAFADRQSTRLNSSHSCATRMPTFD